jgi:hypothetical protein
MTDHGTELYCEICDCDGEEIKDWAGINLCFGCYSSRPEIDQDDGTTWERLQEATLKACPGCVELNEDRLWSQPPVRCKAHGGVGAMPDSAEG